MWYVAAVTVSPSVWRRLMVATLGVVAVVLSAAPIVEASPKKGSFKAKGAISFAFKITKATCVVPPKNLANPKAVHGKRKKGFCFNSPVSFKPVKMTCPNGASLTGETADMNLFSGLRLSSAGSLHLRAYATGQPAIFTELDLMVRGAHASGYVIVNDQAGAVSCTSGKLAFKATRH
jgi:hypothetical protein